MSGGLRVAAALVALAAESALPPEVAQAEAASLAGGSCTVGCCNELQLFNSTAARTLQTVEELMAGAEALAEGAEGAQGSAEEQIVAESGNDGEVKNFSQWERTRYLLVILIPITLFLWIYVSFKLGWERRMKKRARELTVSQESDDLAKTLLEHYMPSVAVGAYEFQGFTRKEETISLSFEELGLELRDGRRVLDGVTGKFDAGHLVAIMGPSGAGKTTFMNVLCGKATYGSMVGEAKVNGDTCRVEALKTVMGFVPQDDIVHEKLTVRENIRYSAELRNPAGTSPADLEDIVVDVLSVLQIGHIQNSIVGGADERGISGGQRKRVNIGLELAATPTLLFLDEPTSGLDSSSSLAIINSLKKMTELGMSIIMVIHQPRYSIFTLFDSVLLLAKGGRTAFLGSSLRAKAYFQSLGFEAPVNDNPADWLMDVISGDVKCENVDTEALPDIWQRGGARRASGAEGEEAEQGRIWSVEDDRNAVENLLSQEFDKFDGDHNRGLSKSEFRHLVRFLLLGKRPSQEAFENLCVPLFGEGENQKRVVTKREFTKFVMSFSDWRRREPTADLEEHAVVARPLNIAIEGLDHAMSRAGIMTMMVQRSTRRGVRTRRIPGFFKQYFLICHRRLVQIFRTSARRVMDVLVLIAAGVIMGQQHMSRTSDASSIFLSMFALSLFLPVNALTCLGANRLMFQRESSSGLNGFAYAGARMTVDSLDVIFQTMIYTTFYYLTSQPPLPSEYYLAAYLLQASVISGWGYLISVVMPAQNAMLAAVVSMLVLNGVLGNPQYAEDFINGGFAEALVALSPARWGMQMLYVEWWKVRNESPPTSTGLMLVVAYKSQVFDQGKDFKDNFQDAATALEYYAQEKEKDEPVDSHWFTAVWVLLAEAIVLRILATLMLCYGDRVPGIGSLVSRCRQRLSKKEPEEALPRAYSGVSKMVSDQTLPEEAPAGPPGGKWPPAEAAASCSPGEELQEAKAPEQAASLDEPPVAVPGRKRGRNRLPMSPREHAGARP